LAANALIAIVDDDDLIRGSLAGLFRSFGVGAETFPSATSFLSGHPERFDVVVSDLHMPGMTGLELKRTLSERAMPMPVIIITAYPERAVEMSQSDKELYLLEKPVDSARLISCIEKAIGRPLG
jgi:FixJ family two-component response regulator